MKKITFLIVILLALSTLPSLRNIPNAEATSAIQLVQGPAQAYSSTSTVSVNMAHTPIEGDTLIAVVGTGSNGISSVTSISETGVTWNRVVRGFYSIYSDIEIWHGAVTGSSPSSSITVNLSSTPAYGAVVDVCEWSGIALVNYTDVTNAVASPFGGTSTPSTGTTPTTHMANELWIGGIYGGGANPQTDPTNGFTMFINSTHPETTYLYKIVDAEGQAGTSTTCIQCNGWVGCIATFKAASAPIYILADGNIDPLTAPLVRNGDVYTLTGNISSDTTGIVLEKSHIILNGSGYSIQGSNAVYSAGVQLDNVENVTITNLEISAFSFGVEFVNSSRNRVHECKISDNSAYGILFNEMKDEANIIDDNIITGSGQGAIAPEGEAVNCVITNNQITNNKAGIIYGPEEGHAWINATISGNQISGNVDGGISFATYKSAGYNNRIIGNNITNNGAGIELLDSCFGNLISENNITQNKGIGVSLIQGPFDNTITKNVIENNGAGVLLSSWGRPGPLAICSGNNVSGNSIKSNLDYGIHLTGAVNNSITENTVVGNANGIVLDPYYPADQPVEYSSDNLISKNTIVGNEQFGIKAFNSTGNQLYQNSFINNTLQVYSDNSRNIWDNGYPSGGNYWSDYSDNDYYNGPNQNLVGSDGIGDRPYVIDVNNTDRYPLTSFGDEFSSTSINARWIWTHQPQNSYMSSGWLVVQPTLGTNFWSGVDSGQFLYQYVSGNFMAQTKVSATLSSNYQQAGLMIRQDAGNWAKIDFEYSNGPTVKTGINRNNVASTGKATTLPTSTATVWLRVVKYGDYFTASYSLDGSTWSQHYSWSQPLLGTLMVGLCVTDANSGVVFQPSFDYFRYSNLVPYPFTKEIDGISYPVSAISNSVASNFSINQSAKMISFNVTGASGTSGFCNITMPRLLLGEPIVVRVDGALMSPVVTSNSTHTSVYFTYIHSTHRVEIVGATIVPEFPTMAANILVMVVLAFLLLLARRRMTAVCQHIPSALSNVSRVFSWCIAQCCKNFTAVVA